VRELDRWERLARAAEGAEPGTPDTLFLAALSDDLALSAAIARVHQLFDEGAVPAALASLALLGLNPLREAALDGATQARIAERLERLKARDFAAADAIRAELAERGIMLKDGKDPATGERVTTWELKR
jgi:cysteinyl-tRNA synthetase